MSPGRVGSSPVPGMLAFSQCLAVPGAPPPNGGDFPPITAGDLPALAELTSCNLAQFEPNTSPSPRLAGIFKLRQDIMATGKVARFFDQKGFGFIQPEGGGTDLFVHINEVEGGQLQEGDTVEYEAIDGPKGPQASSVKVV